MKRPSRPWAVLLPQRARGTGWLLAPLFAVSLAQAAEPSAPDKRGFHLFKPVPDEWLRELGTDRPDRTESPFTVDPGRVQLEMDLLNYSYDRHNSARADERVETVAIAPLNLKLGLWHNVDVQFIVEPHLSVRTRDRTTGSVQKQRGFGDLTVRSKINLWGNDGGPAALAVMPWVKLPTNQDNVGNDAVEGGLIIPLAVSLPGEVGLGLMTEVDVVRDGGGRGHHAEFINTVTLARTIAGKLGGYVEFFSLVSAESKSRWVGTVDFGFTYAVTENIQLDAGVNLGVTRSADDVNPFFGVSWRF